MFIIIGILPRDELRVFLGMDIGICEWDFALPISSPNQLYVTKFVNAKVGGRVNNCQILIPPIYCK